MLQRAAAANPEVRASRHDAIRRGDQNIDQAGLVQMAAPLEHAIANAFPRQCTVDEDGLACVARYPPPVMRQVQDIGFPDVAQIQLAGHAAANSLRWTAGDSSSSLRTRATSWACSVAFKCPRKSSKRKKIK